MSRRYFALTIVLALAAGFAGRSLADARWLTPGAASSSAHGRESDPEEQKWEYCAVLKAQYPGSLRNVFWIAYFKGDRIETVDMETGPTGNPTAKAVVRLGNEGWEMVGQGPLEVRPGGPPSPFSTALYFKRRKQSEK